MWTGALDAARSAPNRCHPHEPARHQLHGVEKVLNHKLQGMLKVYNKHPSEDEKRAALDQWAAELRRIIAGESNVVVLRGQTRRERDPRVKRTAQQ